MTIKTPITSVLSVTFSLLLLGGCGGSSASAPATVTPPTVVQPTPTTPVTQRYVDKIFDNVERTSNIVFGSGARSGNPQILNMDIYTPRGDTETNRPVIILAFGGGFVSGFKRDPLITTLATDFAQRGYVTASIDYRLFEPTPTTEDGANIGIIQAMHDMKAAIRFFREDAGSANTYGTRGDTIFVGGVSAGAIMASFSGALDMGDPLTDPVRDFLTANNVTDGNSSANTNISSDVQGVFSLSGAVSDFQWIDINTAPIYAAHEEFDTVVPCKFSLNNDGFPLAGGCDMVPLAQAAGVPAELYLVEGSDRHIGYSLLQYGDILDGASAFLAEQIPD